MVEIKGLIKTLPSEWFVMVIVVCVGLISFALGRLSALEEGRAPVTIEQTASAASTADVATSKTNHLGAKLPNGEGGLLVASRNSTKYHFPWCSGAQRISEQNKIWFESEEEARAAGYEPAGNCKGLK